MVHMVTFSGMNVCGQFGFTTTEVDEVTCESCLLIHESVAAEASLRAAHEVNLLEKMWAASGTAGGSR